MPDQSKRAELREKYKTRKPQERNSATADKISGLRYPYVDAIVEAREKGELTDEELLFELMRITEMIAEVGASELEAALTPKERKRLVSAGVANHGFIDVCHEQARAMPSLLPSWLTLTKFTADRDTFETLNSLCGASMRFGRQAADMLLRASDTVMRDARAMYHSAQEAADNRVPGAETVLEELKPFYKSRSPHKTDEPTEDDVERDVRSLLHGTKEGRVVVENTKPHTVPGTHSVIDEVK